jgi:hypothetical protein
MYKVLRIKYYHYIFVFLPQLPGKQIACLAPYYLQPVEEFQLIVS